MLTRLDLFRLQWLEACSHPLKFMLAEDMTAPGGLLPANFPCFEIGPSKGCVGGPERELQREFIVMSRLFDEGDFEMALMSWELESIFGALAWPEGGKRANWTNQALVPDPTDKGAQFDLYFAQFRRPPEA